MDDGPGHSLDVPEARAGSIHEYVRRSKTPNTLKKKAEN